MQKTILETSTTPLAASATFTSAIVNMIPEDKLLISIYTDKAGTAYVEHCIDPGTPSWTTVATVTLVANIETKIWTNPPNLGTRLRLVNGASAQTFLKLYIAKTSDSLD